MSEAAAHVARFNTAVTTGDWTAFLAALHPDAVMTFIGPPAGPFRGREAIAAAYTAQPPDDTIRILGIEGDVITFAWSRGGTGTLTLVRRDGLIAEMTIAFD